MPKQEGAHPTETPTPPLLESVERELDANYRRVALPHRNKTIATWYLLTVLEDSFRVLFVLSEDDRGPTVAFQLDRHKYSARFALDRIRQECIDTSQAALPRRVISKLYSKTAELLQAGVDFMAATQLCSAAHARTVHFSEGDQTIDIVFDGAHHDKRYAALELLGHTTPDVIDHSTSLYAWARRNDLRPHVVDAIAKTVQISEQAVVYEYDPSLAVGLSQEMMQQPSLVPEGWQFPWGGRYETIILVNAMCVRCMYHWVAVHFGAALGRLRGGGDASLLHVTSMSQLVGDLREMCSLDEAPIRRFLQYLTYGHGTRTPDPALQPIIPLGNGQLAIPCLMYLSSNYERNLLALQARIDSRAFDRMSRLFETNMISELLTEIGPRWPFANGNVTIRADGGFEEMDLLIAEPASQTVLVCELRWMLQPGDPREVQNRKKACQDKVAQLARKVRWSQSRVHALLASLGIEPADPDSWRVAGIVVIRNFGGTLSGNDRHPIMTERVFVQGMRRATSLSHFADWSQSLHWLPQEDVHFRIVPNEVHLSALGKNLVALGIEKLCTPRDYVEFVSQSLALRGN